ncbi:MAG TPA: MFS transporter [Spirochaetia bacterium]|nr:MFS transporter [Spirochaetia bacterium]
MDDSRVTVYRYRWLVLAVFSLLNLVVQLQWLTFAPVATIAQVHYHVTPLAIDMLSMVYMLVFIIFSIPASHIIDTFGLRFGVGIGAALLVVFGVLKALFADSYPLVLVAQIGLAISQPFAMNAVTKLSAHWFPVRERATAAGIVSLCQYLGFIVAMVLTPILVAGSGNGANLRGAFVIYAILSVASGALLLLFLRDRPATPPSLTESTERYATGEGLKHIFRQPSMVYLMILFFVGLGMFNAVSTVIDQIGSAKGLSADQSGLVGGIMIIGGIIGAVIVPVWSDKVRKRRPFIVVCAAGMVPGLLGIMLVHSYGLLLVAGFVLGFFVMSAGPVGFQYSAEISYPAPESSAQGLLILAGQVSGVIFILAMDSVGIAPLLVLFVVLLSGSVYFATRMKESPVADSAAQANAFAAE